ncbi:MAG: 2-hydroxyacid dehydrogenase [Leucobacter sp.]
MSIFTVTLPSDPGLREAVEQAAQRGGLRGEPRAELRGGSRAEEVEFVEWDLDGPPPRSRADIVVPPYWGGVKRLAAVSQLETLLVQWQSIGFNWVDRFLPEGVPFANAATVHESSTAELAVGLAIAAQRGIPEFVRAADEHRWQQRRYPSLADRRVLLVGYGGVAKQIEARLAGFEVEITRIARTARQDRDALGNPVEVRGLDDLHACLAEAEVVMLAIPLNDSTHGLIDAAALAAMPDGALLVNVARGPVVDTDALMAELNAGRLRAAIDVVDPEPLPEDHPLWSCPGILISPHVGGDSTAMQPRIAALIHRQIAHLRAGEQPENLVLGIEGGGGR